ncbi:RagB/SusD family nutrient uptake outer membrane protein [Prevotella sp.]|uniref:RagB/SusD family nutrient uptake outer membrane protein n=1 Tax=uncultured Prevotella sp. TaxID=159272 RepID=UPI001CB42238|nr:RagB/SusD family nutrient uptake outer membrane protein [Prevotella sp.]MBF1430771.1 RagB/SusD family nutrient uptake outer membrane protein [Prevotella melaninogenica]MBF1579179.1 RagB/SusD family nutrient uptake outer membrane protein [Prevotella sp.]MBF1612829.1 RagB/SusD family nutrient uptake outer membrane protein [Prevotella sp.]
MKNIISNILRGGLPILCLGMTVTSCSDFLDRPPLDQISPDSYYTTADQLGTFTINYYTSIFPNNSGWFAGVATFDDGTDNQASRGGNSGMYLQDQWKVPTSGGIGMNAIRNVNKFINESEAKIAAGKVTGTPEQINQYMGEAYFIRAMLYYSKLQDYGDFPIELKELNVNNDLVEASKRQPRNLVARQILSDMDKAIDKLQVTFANKVRINKNAALAMKSRMALYEATFEKYHRGTGRVPGDANWPGKNKEWNKNFTINQDDEVNFFLDQAIDAAKKVCDAVPLKTQNSHVMNPSSIGQYNGWNSYYDMFASPDLSKYPEVLLWRQFNSNLTPSLAHLTSNKLRGGASTGWTRGLVESFLMKNGLPIYASGSGYHGDTTVDMAKTDRDERLQLFMFGESDVLGIDQKSIDLANKKLAAGATPLTKILFNAATLFATDQASRDVTGYRQRKFYNYDPAMQLGQTFSDVDGQIIIRVEEAMLNYIEASYLRTGSLDATATGYWTALRARAGITAPISTTIAATDMSKEADVNRPSYDWAAFSAGHPVDATLYSIRRERRSEFAGEGLRNDDLIRWASLDQVKNYQIEGVNFWDQIYQNPSFVNDKGVSLIIADGESNATMSAKTLSKYVRPYQIQKTNNILYDGYTFYQAHYLSPFSYQEMQLCSPDGNAENSNLYQNIYWPVKANGEAIK